jgi:Ca2+-binding EF-hand superfamily protein
MEGTYDVPYDTKKKFSAAELTELTSHFKAYDSDKSGRIEKSELKIVLVQLGHRETKEEDVVKLLEGFDLNSDNELNF